MHRLGLRLVSVVALFLFVSRLASGAASYITFPADIDWVERRSAHFEAIYRRGSDRLAERTLAAAERAYRLLSPFFDEKPDLTRIVIADFTHGLNGYSIDFPYPHIVIYATPPDAAGELSSLDDWLDSVVLHEFTHTLHLYPASWVYRPMRWIFGSWVLPNGLLPTHLHEGLATLAETQLTHGGRGRGPTFAMYRRAAVAENVWGTSFLPLDLLDGLSPRWPGGSSPYFFGFQLYRDLYRRRGAEGIRDWARTTSGQFPYFLSRSTEKVYGRDYPTLWNEVFERGRTEAQAEIAAFEKDRLAKLEYWTDSRFAKWDLAATAAGDRIAFRQASFDKPSEIQIQATEDKNKSEAVAINPGHVEGLGWITLRGRAQLLFTELRTLNYYDLYQRTQLSRFDPTTKEKVALEGGAGGAELFGNVYALGTDPNSADFVVYEELAGKGTVAGCRIADDGKVACGRRWTLPEGSWVSSLAAQGGVRFFLLRQHAYTELYRWADGDPQRVATLPGHFYNLRTATRGRCFALGAIDGRDEVWSIDWERGQVAKVVALVNGADAFDTDGKRWWLSAYRHGGYDLARTEAPAPAKTRSLASLRDDIPKPETTPAASLSPVREYSAWPTILPRAWLPSFLLVPAGIQISAFVPGFDVAQRHNYSLFGGYDTRGSPFVDFLHSYRFAKTWSIDTEPYYAPTYLISSQTFLVQWGVSSMVSFGPSALPFRVGIGPVFRRVEPSATTPSNQSVGVQLSVSRNLGFRRIPLAIAPSRGTRLGASYSRFFQALGSDDEYYSTVFTIDQFLASPWIPTHVFLFSFRLGFTEGTALFNSFFQGGGELQFSPGPGLFLNRGFYPGTFLSQRLANLSVEYRFPLARVYRGWGIAPFFLQNLHAGLVADTTTGDFSSFGWWQSYFTSAGLELKSDWVTSYYFPVRVRVGGYHGFGPYGQPLYLTMAIESGF